MQVLMLVLHIMLVILNTVLSVMNFKNKQHLLGTLWAVTVPLWAIQVVLDVIKIS